jgi:hypothetical protein
MKKQLTRRFKKLLMLGLCNLTSGIVFGAGCLIAEHIDGTWGQSGEAPPAEVINKAGLTRYKLTTN